MEGGATPNNAMVIPHHKRVLVKNRKNLPRLFVASCPWIMRPNKNNATPKTDIIIWINEKREKVSMIVEIIFFYYSSQ